MRKFLCILICLGMVVGISACNDTPFETQEPHEVMKNLNPTSYGEFEGGLSAFAENTGIMLDYIFYENTKNINTDNFSAKGKEYFENCKLLLSLLEVELAILPEYDTLKASAEYFDRAEGNLYSVDAYGYRIQKESGIIFGCQGDYIKQTGELLADESDLLFTTEENLSETVRKEQRTEAIILPKNEIAFQYEITVKNGEETRTQAVFMLLRNGKAQIAYYEGDIGLEKIIKLRDLVDYNMDAMTFRTGYVFSMNIDI